ncbi:hypothetical protein [Lactobacillus intestinalis]|uniref:hypothetical protein n=1 Tax=Lactobacillus intestinalis TaxID=151781 RepID=UPI001F566A08|nr:hypothetical protein [Lactobacillus intestinalis]
MDFTPWISALPGILSLAWQAYTYFKQKPKLSIESNRQDYPNLIVDKKLCPIQYGGPHLSLNLEISNSGNYPYTIRNIEAWYEDEQKWVPLLNREYHMCGLELRNEYGQFERLKFNQFKELNRPLKIKPQDTEDIHLCVSPDCLKSDNTITLRFYHLQEWFDMDFQLGKYEEYLNHLNYTVCGFLPPDS